MKKLALLLLIPFVLSCSKKEGCTDSSATNFDSSAEKNDGSCLYNPTDVYISSAVASPTSSESVTLINNIGSTIDIGGWTLGDLNDPTSYSLPNSTVLTQGGAITFSSTQLTFQINDSGETLYLKDNSGITRDTWSN